MQIVALMQAVRAAKLIQSRGERETGKSINVPVTIRFTQDIMYRCQFLAVQYGKTSLINFWTIRAGIKISG
ncbi:hypothetical protein PGTUg99_005475 [Puccinia graminis f. sp. tritici]|uniref:Uncharacterized protein n=1 Tax=Puccinia graminis f. sp. tritici TaxID=56615 RepID=A0A5B0NQL2_PUCGR|nr:hypothetical protein PGTUg99_005475 [Puccinia graminis f. sp. tritici]